MKGSRDRSPHAPHTPVATQVAKRYASFAFGAELIRNPPTEHAAVPSVSWGSELARHALIGLASLLITMLYLGVRSRDTRDLPAAGAPLPP